MLFNKIKIGKGFLNEFSEAFFNGDEPIYVKISITMHVFGQFVNNKQRGNDGEGVYRKNIAKCIRNVGIFKHQLNRNKRTMC